MITEVKEVIVEEKTYSGSAFGVTQAGDGVFFNARIVEAVGLDAGALVKAYLVPNFPDKRHSIPWRAMRVEVLNSNADLVGVDTTGADLVTRIHDLLGEAAVFSAEEVAEELGADVEVVRKLLENDNQIHSEMMYYM